MSAEASIPGSVEELVRSMDAIMATPDAPETGTLVVQPGSRFQRPVRRIALALESWPRLPAWIGATGADALFLHRHRSFDPAILRGNVAVVANHDGFDRRFGFGDNRELQQRLGLNPVGGLGEENGFPLGTVGDGAPRTIEALRMALVAAFSGIEEEAAPAALRTVRRIAIARAMNAELVGAAERLGADVYITGQIRHPGRDPAASAGLHVFGIGHRRAEEWSLSELGGALERRWPGLIVLKASTGAR